MNFFYHGALNFILELKNTHLTATKKILFICMIPGLFKIRERTFKLNSIQ